MKRRDLACFVIAAVVCLGPFLQTDTFSDADAWQPLPSVTACDCEDVPRRKQGKKDKRPRKYGVTIPAPNGNGKAYEAKATTTTGSYAFTTWVICAKGAHETAHVAYMVKVYHGDITPPNTPPADGAIPASIEAGSGNMKWSIMALPGVACNRESTINGQTVTNGITNTIAVWGKQQAGSAFSLIDYSPFTAYKSSDGTTDCAALAKKQR